MSTITTDYFTTLAQQAQDASRAATESWVRTVQSTSTRLPAVTGVAAAHEVIDQLSDFTISLVNVQRALAKQLTESFAGAAESAVKQAQDVVKDAQDAARKAQDGIAVVAS
jgi:hypothetical protein